MSIPIGDFVREVRLEAKRLPKEVVLPFQKKVSLEVFTRLVNRTPVDTGRARGAWAIEINETPATFEQMTPFAFVSITNNVPYIERLEDGWSQQAPQGMAGLTFEELSGWLKRIN